MTTEAIITKTATAFNITREAAEKMVNRAEERNADTQRRGQALADYVNSGKTLRGGIANFPTREELIAELRQLDNPRICRSENEWEKVNARKAEICKILNVEFPEDVL